MSTDLTQPIRFIRPSRYGAVGSQNATLDWGVRATLVERGTAEWVEEITPEVSRESKKHKSFSKGN